MTTNAIEVENLTKSYDQARSKTASVLAVDHINFQIRQGELFGFLGPNGAGKTTTINMLTGLARPDAGTIHIAGIDCSQNPKAAQHLIGIVPDDSNLYPELSGFDNLCFCAALYGMGKQERQTRARELLELFGLEEAADRKFAGYSKGMKRKLTIAAGIIHDPQILFLDEPTTGIDVESARQIRQLIADLNQDGTTIFLTTHYIEEAERLYDRIAFIVHGRIARIDTVANLLQPVQEKQAMLFSVSNSAAVLCDTLAGAFSHLTFHATSSDQIRVTSTEGTGVENCWMVGTGSLAFAQTWHTLAARRCVRADRGQNAWHIDGLHSSAWRLIPEATSHSGKRLADRVKNLLKEFLS